MVRRGLGKRRLASVLGVLDVLLDERDREDLPPGGFLAIGRVIARDAGVQERVKLFKHGGLVPGRRFLGRVATDRQVLLEAVDCGRALFNTRLQVPVHPEDVLRDLAVALFIDVVGDDEE